MNKKSIFAEGGGEVMLSGLSFRGTIVQGDKKVRLAVYDGHDYASALLTQDRLDQVIDALLEVRAFMGPSEKDDDSA